MTIDETSLKIKKQIMLPIADIKKPRGLDYDFDEKFVYYSDSRRHLIERQNFEGTIREKVIDIRIRNCYGLAIDWIGKNLYWSDESLAQISVAKLSNTTQRKILVQRSSFYPKAIVLNPRKGDCICSKY